MASRHLRAAFNEAAGGALTCVQALMDTARDKNGEHSILTFTGTRAAGESFKIASRPVRAGEEPNDVAAETALKLAAEGEEG